MPSGRVEITHVGNQTYAAFIRDHELTTDQPVEAGGGDDGLTPVELFVVSLASCVGYYAGRFLQRHHVPDEHLRIRADFTMATDRPARVASIRLQVRVPQELDPARLEALRAVVDHCTVHNTLRQPPEITLAFGSPTIGPTPTGGSAPSGLS
ncbi:OsmC family protein [Streptomyces sp. NPDC047082]|uniref:OsmC family protein n=1 Tax=Streptomyces sp. NPDC047082 TaxID=3155259 RepID=UPI0033E50986